MLEMDKQVIDFQINNSICEGYGCINKATTKIHVKVGQLGSISLDLCINCMKKFEQKEKALESVLQPLSNTNQSIQPLSMQGVHQQND